MATPIGKVAKALAAEADAAVEGDGWRISVKRGDSGGEVVIEDTVVTIDPRGLLHEVVATVCRARVRVLCDPLLCRVRATCPIYPGDDPAKAVEEAITQYLLAVTFAFGGVSGARKASALHRAMWGDRG